LTVRGTKVTGLRDSEVIGESIERRAKAVAFSRSIVQCVRDCVASVLCQPLHRRALRDVLPNEAVGVLVRASFPRRVRSRKVDRYARRSFDLVVSVELRTVVDGDRLEQPGMSLNQLNDAMVDGGGSTAPQFADQGCSGDTLDQGSGYTPGMKTAVSIPDEVFEKVERIARRARKSRSEVFSAALREYVARHAPDEVTDSINRVCDRIGEQDDPFVRSAARRILEKAEW